MAAREAESPLEQSKKEAFKTRIRAAVAQSISALPRRAARPLRLDLASAHDSRLELGKCCSWTAHPDGSFHRCLFESGHSAPGPTPVPA
jgi:hypothetical protein